jgi:hypothetical protein
VKSACSTHEGRKDIIYIILWLKCLEKKDNLEDTGVDGRFIKEIGTYMGQKHNNLF